jgi:hypothetical protein
MSKESAKLILGKVFPVLPVVKSLVDFGPGSGDWMVAANELGITDLKCYGLPYEVEIPKELQGLVRPMPLTCSKWFEEADFRAPVKVRKARYDLALCLEVGEHIEEESAETLIKSLTAASDFVLFSAAVPYQWGDGHINIHWPSYWAKLFETEGYKAADFIRYQLWGYTQEEVEVHYKQNMVLYVKSERYSELKLPEFDYSKVLNLAHPYLYCTIHGEGYGDPDRRY